MKDDVALHIGDIVRMKKRIPAAPMNGRLPVRAWILASNAGAAVTL